MLDEADGVGRAGVAVETAVVRRRFTRAEYHRMAEVGILEDSDRVELIRGDIITKLPQGRRHRAFTDNLNQLLATRHGTRARRADPAAASVSPTALPDVALTLAEIFA
jgi:hypothetical protein